MRTMTKKEDLLSPLVVAAADAVHRLQKQQGGKAVDDKRAVAVGVLAQWLRGLMDGSVHG